MHSLGTCVKKDNEVHQNSKSENFANLYKIFVPMKET